MDEAKLVAGLKSRDPETIQELVASHGNRLLRSAFLLCGNESEAQDLVQDTFVAAWRSVHRFRGTSTVYTWLHSILLNLTRHYRRKRNRIIYDNDIADLESSCTEDHPSQLDVIAASNELTRALDRLSDSHREVLILRFYEHLKIHEIARQLGISSGTVKSRLHYAISEMQKYLPAEVNLFGASGTNETGTR